MNSLEVIKKMNRKKDPKKESEKQESQGKPKGSD